MTATARILIVDDDPTAIELLAHTLEGLGELCYATGGADALAVMADDPADLILLDANMPDMDGFTTCGILKQEYPDIPILFVTAFNAVGRELQALKCGAVDFIHKPIRPPVVRARVGVHLQLRALTAELHALGNRDPLTGIANRRALDERLAQEWRRAARQQQALALLMIDVDHFKRYNDHYGHLQGDACLRQVAQALAAALPRSSDLVARYGGEEFAVLLPGSSLEAAAALGAKVCAVVRALAIAHAASDTATQVTVSVGAAGAAGLQPVEALLARADRALYAAKSAGRDRVCVE